MFVQLTAARVASLLYVLSVPARALYYVPGSPCQSLCSDSTAGTLENDTVCQDTSFSSGTGAQIQSCTACLLNSTAVDTANNISDVYWGLFQLRYTLSECMYAYPTEIVSTSSPCQVTCSSLRRGVTYGIGANLSTATQGVLPTLDFCNKGFGGDYAINNCTFCYQYVPQQLYLGNFMQALHIACRDPPALGSTFYPDAAAIFNETVIAGPQPPGPPPTINAVTGLRLALAIVLPLLGGIMLLVGACLCLWRFTKSRRDRMASEGRMKRVRAGLMDEGSYYSSPLSAVQKSDWPVGAYEPAREMTYLQRTTAGRQKSPVFRQNEWYGTEADVSEIGPGRDQEHDPYLHERYFGTTASPEDEGHPGMYEMGSGGPDGHQQSNRSHWA